MQQTRDDGLRTSIDLIYGLPSQTSLDIEQTLALNPDHIAAYTLTIEAGTNFHKRGMTVDHDLQAELTDTITSRLGDAGYERYEVSAYARSGEEAIHNALYWNGTPYLGVGAGAHSYWPAPDLSSALRTETTRDPVRYMESGGFEFEEQLDRIDVLGERLFTGVRTRAGVDLEALGVQSATAAVVQQLTDEGLLTLTGTRIAPTARGFDLADGIGRRLMTALDALR